MLYCACNKVLMVIAFVSAQRKHRQEHTVIHVTPVSTSVAILLTIYHYRDKNLLLFLQVISSH